MEVRGEEPLLLFHLWEAGPEFDFEAEDAGAQRKVLISPNIILNTFALDLHSLKPVNCGKAAKVGTDFRMSALPGKGLTDLVLRRDRSWFQQVEQLQLAAGQTRKP